MDPLHVRERLGARVREMAIEKAKVSMASLGREPSDFSEEQLEMMVNDEERKIRESIKSKALGVALAAIGIQIF